MSSADMVALMPFIVLTLAPIAVILTIAFHRSHRLTMTLALAGLLLSLAAVPTASYRAPLRIGPLLIVDHYALFFLALICLASLGVTLLSYGYLQKRSGPREEFYVLLLLATLGAGVLVASTHFASLFLGLEILSVALYALVAYWQGARRGLEAGVKYLILAGVSAAFLLFGMALLYAGLGSMGFDEMASRASAIDRQGPLLFGGLSLLVVGIGFKLAFVPFHLWTPDVYEGAPAPVTAFVATVSKGAMFALLLRFFSVDTLHNSSSLFLVFTVIATASMFVGNLLALFQDNLKRLLAYSSIAHLGYLLVAFQASSSMAAAAVAYYLVAYFITTLGAFGVITVLSDGDREVEMIGEYRGLAWRRPWLAAVLISMLLSLAGLPLTAGFVAKFYIVAAGVGSALWWQVLCLVTSSAIGLFYYLRVIISLFMPSRALASERRESPQLSLVDTGVLAMLTILLACLGVYPAPLVEIIGRAVTVLI
jgi:NADH-quinone oxidoreductase subunit N